MEQGFDPPSFRSLDSPLYLLSDSRSDWRVYVALNVSQNIYKYYMCVSLTLSDDIFFSIIIIKQNKELHNLVVLVKTLIKENKHTVI